MRLSSAVLIALLSAGGCEHIPSSSKLPDQCNITGASADAAVAAGFEAVRVLGEELVEHCNLEESGDDYAFIARPLGKCAFLLTCAEPSADGTRLLHGDWVAEFEVSDPTRVELIDVAH